MRSTRTSWPPTRTATSRSTGSAISSNTISRTWRRDDRGDEAMNAPQNLHALGQSLWLDNTTRELLTSGTLRRYIRVARALKRRETSAPLFRRAVYQIHTNPGHAASQPADRRRADPTG